MLTLHPKDSLMKDMNMFMWNISDNGGHAIDGST